MTSKADMSTGARGENHVMDVDTVHDSTAFFLQLCEGCFELVRFTSSCI